MRYEAKHNYFKSIAQRIKCFKNISKSLANHHQRLLCLLISSPNGLELTKEDLTGPGKQLKILLPQNIVHLEHIVQVESLPYYTELQVSLCINEDDTITRYVHTS